MVDDDPFFDYEPIGEPKIFVSDDGKNKIKWRGNLFKCTMEKKELTERVEYIIQEKWFQPGINPTSRRRWNCWSGVAALAVPVYLQKAHGATDIELVCFGVTLAGVDDQEGKIKELSRDEQRWKDERLLWTDLTGILEREHGVKVRMVAA